MNESGVVAIEQFEVNVVFDLATLFQIWEFGATTEDHNLCHHVTLVKSR